MKKNKSMCDGCCNDIYNHPPKVGQNFKSAKVVSRKKVSINQVPPWNQKPIKVLDCRRESGYCLIRPEITC